MALTRDPNLADPDAFYTALIEAHSGLTEAESAALSARLILLLANHVGDVAVLGEAIAAARGHPVATDPKRPPSAPTLV